MEKRNKMTYHTIETAPQSNRKITKRGNIDTSNLHNKVKFFVQLTGVRVLWKEYNTIISIYSMIFVQ